MTRCSSPPGTRLIKVLFRPKSHLLQKKDDAGENHTIPFPFTKRTFICIITVNVSFWVKEVLCYFCHLTWIAHVVQARKQQLHFVSFLFSIHLHFLEPEMRFLSIAGHKLIRPSLHVVGIIWFGQRCCICDEGRCGDNVILLLSWFPEPVDEELLA